MDRFFERLESRQLLSAAQIDYASFASTTGLVTNGYESAATTSGNKLELTDGATEEARSVFYATKVPIDTFTSNFSFKFAAGDFGYDGNLADGLTFVIDNGTTADLGANGQDLAYSSGTFGSQSVDVQFNVYNNGDLGSAVAFTSGGVRPTSSTDASPVDFHSGDTIHATVTYDGTTLAVSLKDATTHQTFSTSEAIDLSSVLGANTAYVGFTGATGNDASIQTVSSFSFAGSAPPTITSAASSSPTPVTGTKAHLTVAAVSNSGGTLTYTWSVVHVPSGAPTPTIKPNGTGAADSSTAHFFKDGTYRFRVTVTDSNGGSSVSDVSVVVAQTATAVKITPHKAQIDQGTTEQYHATIIDQFDHALRTQPTITYAVTTGSGSIDDLTGLYTASGAVGHLVISASADELDGIAGAVVLA